MDYYDSIRYSAARAIVDEAWCEGYAEAKKEVKELLNSDTEQDTVIYNLTRWLEE